MIIFKVIMVWLVLFIAKTTERFGLKTVVLVTTALILALFGDTLIPAIFHLLHLMWELTESIIEHFLEAVFHLTPRQAEFIVAWMGILTMLAVGIRLLYQAYWLLFRLLLKLQHTYGLVKADLRANPTKLGLLLCLVSVGTYGASFFLF
jgi:hypothetical protein